MAATSDARDGRSRRLTEQQYGQEHGNGDKNAKYARPETAAGRKRSGRRMHKMKGGA